MALGTERDRAGGVSGKRVATKIPLPGHFSERFALACDIFLKLGTLPVFGNDPAADGE